MKNSTLITIVCSLIMAWTVNIFASCEYAQALKVEEFAMGNMLTWKTAKEVNNKLFFIQKSTDGNNYQTIGKVKGRGTTSEEKAYRFLDVAASEGVTHYRLKQMDFDGTNALSKVVQISKTSDNNFVVLSMTPLEQAGIVEITVNALNAIDLTYTVEKDKGQIVYEGVQNLKRGMNIVSVDISKMELGIYRISLKGLNESETVTFKTTKKQPLSPFADYTDGN